MHEIATNVKNELMATVGEDVSAAEYNDLSCLLPPATKRAFNFKSFFIELNFSLMNIEDLIIFFV